MRLHQLRVSAFGPFTETVEIDFDALSAAGLFLLAGPTGAGKTSVLDAVCFALYGDVPGDRSSAKRLRSDHAAPAQAPEVTLEATLAGRRFRFVRSPAWERPKKRGTGTTRQQASIVLSERVEGQWVTLSTRLDEAGDLVASLLGMNLDQFCQVAMLPQGRFQAFLRARSEERQALLQQLFRTARFARVESWLRDRRLSLHRASRQSHDKVAGLVNRFSEAAGHLCPDDWDLAVLDAPAADGALRAWLEDGLQVLDRTVQETELASAEHTAQEDQARTAFEHARTLAAQQERFRSAETRWTALAEDEDLHTSRLAELAAARRAGMVLPLQRVAEATRRRSEEHRSHLATLRAGLADEGVATPEQDLASVCVEVVGRRRALAPAQEAERDLPDARDRLAELASELGSARLARDRARTELELLPHRRTELEHSLQLARTAHGRLPGLEERVSTCRRRLAARLEADGVVTELAAAEEERRAVHDQTQALVEVWLDLREARLEGMAAEIAGALTAGCHCPVCGSAEHPRPAHARSGAPDAATERSAQRRADDARASLVAHDDRVRQLRIRLEVAADTAGDSTCEQLQEMLQEATRALREAQELVSALPAHERDLSGLLLEEQGAHDQLRAAERDCARVEASLEDLAQDIRRKERTVAVALEATEHPTVALLCEHLDRLEEGLRVAATTEETLRTLEEQLREHEEALTRALHDQGFADLASVASAARPVREQERLEAAVQEHEDQRARLLAVLDDPELARAAADPVPDLESLGQAHARARSQCEASRTEADRARRALHRAERLGEDLVEALDQWDPVRREHATVSALAALTEGKSVDNRLQMRLSAYVLAYRLTQVVDAANTRLSTMSDQRYTLQHSGQRGAGESRGGLSLTVLDAWSGTGRDPVTLSGGETFIVSLALALGLADVIAQEAGGADLDTLFVDEGFGSLDAESLDHVLDTLDSLRDGGRVVGVVSHVTEMGERIPVQLQVVKTRRGSSLTVTGGH